ncbi:Uncharacterized conserved protein [Phaffia rhodozyma]|uniref:Uncharacterized conserved protein n=1 Tax=Phaffia rhodozyma TaxID=264483 RepID=A0A0F7SGF2_PHARH|nr:Uncharacterized conserved protein [Phaffia rhodozyma]
MDSTQSNISIRLVAYISPQNTPIYFRSYPASSSPQADLVHWHHAFAALDHVDGQTAPSSAGGKEGYFGLIMVLDELAVYGYKPSSNITIIVSFQLKSQPIRDSDVLTIFHALHQAYLLTISNPFHPQPILSNPAARDRWNPKNFEGNKQLEKRLGEIVAKLA